MSAESFASVWDAIEDGPQAAENMRLRAALMMALDAHITRLGMSQAQAAKMFGVTQPRVSDLVRGKINLFGLDSLANMVAAAGLHVEMRVRSSLSEATRGRRAVLESGLEVLPTDVTRAPLAATRSTDSGIRARNDLFGPAATHRT